MEEGHPSPLGGQQRHFEDFDYNKEKAKKASQVIMSINAEREDEEAQYMVNNGDAESQSND